MKRALRYSAVDRGVLSVEEGVKDADIIILATPVSLIPKISKGVIKYAKEGAVITDAGSTKTWIVNKIEKMLKGSKTISFVGSHPMAGSEHTGVEFARAGLLKGSPCIVTKTNRTNKNTLNKIIRFWGALGADVKVMSPAAHDKSISMISHLPHLVAFSLAGAVSKKDLAYAAEGFKDTTRVASSSPTLWADIFLSNTKEVLRSGRLFEKYYKKIIQALSEKDYSKVVKLLEKAKAIRDSV